MDVIEYTPVRDEYAYTFGGAAPAMRINPGTALRLWSDDAFRPRIRHSPRNSRTPNHITALARRR